MKISSKPTGGSFLAKGLRSFSNLQIRRRAPFSLVHFITNRCNARCRHCFIDFENNGPSPAELSTDEIVELTKHTGGELFNVNLTGGEPFLRKDVFEIAQAYFSNAGVGSVFITTNGMFTASVAEFIDKFIRQKTAGNIIFSVSIDNFDEEHDRNRRSPGLFKNAMNTLSLIQGYGLPNVSGGASITIAEHNYGSVAGLYGYLESSGIEDITVTPQREEGVIKKIDPETKKKIYGAYCDVLGLMERGGHKKKKANPERRLILAKNAVFNRIIKDTYLKPRFISRCPAGSLFVVIAADGNVLPCEMLGSPLGNVKDYGMDLVRLLGAGKAEEARRSIRDNRCNCIYGCAWTVNILSNPRYLPQLAYNCIRNRR